MTSNESDVALMNIFAKDPSSHVKVILYGYSFIFY